MQTYPRLTIEDFGRHLLDTNELDPIYVALSGAPFKRCFLQRWLLAYWCFYDAGVACHIAEHEGEYFWEVMDVAARNEKPCPTGGRWPRAAERRHFRGQQAITAVAKLRERYGDRPEGMVEYVAGDGGPFAALAKRAKSHYKFGDWIAFKCGDMVERVLGVPVDFTEADVFMAESPREAALMVAREKFGLLAVTSEQDRRVAIRTVVEHLVSEFQDYKAPPRGDRPVALQEVETVLCKYKSHVNGHYPLFNDIDAIRAGIVPWVGISEAARRLAETMPGRTVIEVAA